jgi:ApaG protein
LDLPATPTSKAETPSDAEVSSLGSEVVTRGVRVIAQPRFDEERSDPSEGSWFFVYTITICNEGEVPLTLLARRWVITDDDGKVETVEGPGVVGEQPRLEPGECFTYSSGCPLGTRFGVMEGTYLMLDDEGDSFEAAIAPFILGFVHEIN